MYEIIIICVFEGVFPQAGDAISSNKARKDFLTVTDSPVFCLPPAAAISTLQKCKVAPLHPILSSTPTLSGPNKPPVKTSSKNLVGVAITPKNHITTFPYFGSALKECVKLLGKSSAAKCWQNFFDVLLSHF